MFTHLDDFRRVWGEEVADTLKVFNAIPDANLGQAVTPEHRDLRRTAWHLVETIVEMPSHIGLRIEGVAISEQGFAVDPPPASMAEIQRVYQKVSEGLSKAITDWTDEELQKEDLMYGHLTWKRGQTLFALVVHQIHHRGQMTVLMRQAALSVPEFYGPVKEDWAKMGMDAPAV